MADTTLPMEPPRRFKWRSVPSMLRYYTDATYSRYKKAPIFAKGVVWLFLCLNLAMGLALLTIGPKAIAQKMYDLAQAVRELPYGWLILVAVIAITSFPPLIGWSTTVTVCGFAYGLDGWYVASIGALFGAAMSFTVLRLMFRERIRAWARQNPRWTALENVIRARGLPLIILIRLSPFPPWVYANLLFASIETVSFFQFMIATLLYTSKLFIGVWIGSRIAMFSDGTQRDKMDTKTKIVNVLSVVLGVGLALAAGWFTWRLTEREIRTAPGGEAGEDTLATEALESAVDELQVPLIRSFSGERYRDEPPDEPRYNDPQRGKALPSRAVDSNRPAV